MYLLKFILYTFKHYTSSFYLCWSVPLFLCQGWAPIPDRSGGGRRSVLSGSGGRHHRANPPLHPGSCSQHLQCHADEPQLCSADTGAVQLAGPPHQVKKNLKRIQRADENLTKMQPNIPSSCLSFSGPSQTPPPLFWRRPVSESKRVCPCGTSPGFQLAHSSGDVRPSLNSSLRHLALQE